MALLDLMIKTGQAIAKGMKAAGTSNAQTSAPRQTVTPGGDKGFPLSGLPTSSASAATTQTRVNDAAKTGMDDYGRTDYSVLLKNAMNAGATAGEVEDILAKRTKKAIDTPGYGQYAHDDVYTQARAYIDAQSKPTYDLSDQLRKQAAAETEAALAGLKGAYTKGIAAYDAKMDKLPERYQGAMNSAAAQSAMAKKAFDEQAAASGLNSGASGQAALDASAVYQGNISNLQQSRASDMAEIDRAKAALTADYETAVAKAQAEGNAELAKALYQELIRVQGLQREDDQIAYDRGQDEKKWTYQLDERDYQRGQDTYNQKLQAAATMAEFGNFNGYAELWGLDEQTVNAMVAEYARQKQISEQQAALELDSMRLNNKLAEKQIANYGKSTGGSGVGNLTPPSPAGDIYQEMYAAGIRDEAGAYAYLTAKGYGTTQVETLTDYFMDYAAKRSEDDRPKVSAAAQLKVDLSRNIPMDKKVDAIQGALAVGSILPDEAQELLNFIGLDDEALKRYGY